MPPLRYTIVLCYECAGILGLKVSFVSSLQAKCELCGLNRLVTSLFSAMPAADLRMALPAAKLKRDQQQLAREEAEIARQKLEVERRALELAQSLAKNNTPQQLRRKLEDVKQRTVPQRKRVIDLN